MSETSTSTTTDAPLHIISTETNTHIPLSYTEARALYQEAEKALLKVQVSIRGFIFSRWVLGSYFEEERKKLGAEWQNWLREKWPEVSMKTASLWIAFHARTSLSSIQDTKLPTLKNNYLHSLQA